MLPACLLAGSISGEIWCLRGSSKVNVLSWVTVGRITAGFPGNTRCMGGLIAAYCGGVEVGRQDAAL